LAKSILKESVPVRPWRQVPAASPTTWVPQPAGPESGENGGSAHPRTASEDLAAPTSSPFPGKTHSREGLLERARSEADAILSHARVEAEQIREAARREGYEAGRTTGLTELAAERQRLGELVAQIGDAFREFCADQVPALAEIASQATSRLLREQLALEPERVLTIVDQALENVFASARIIMHLHPEDEELVRTHLASRDARQTGSVELVADVAVERGGCWLETEHGEVDATVAGRVGRLARALDEVG